MRTPLAFDGHNDLLLQMWRAGGAAAAERFASGLPGQIDRARVRTGGYGAAFFAVYVPSPVGAGMMDEMMQPEYDLPLPDPVPQAEAMQVAMGQIAVLLRLQELGHLTICRSVPELRDCLAADRLAAILHMEGAEAIGPDLAELEVLHAAGLRSLGPVWSRPTIFGEGVPFRYPSGPDTGGGLTEAGRRLVRRCDALRVMIDLSHLNEAGFWEVADLSEAPLVATHSNVHAICPHARNLTDRQLDAIAERDGMVGLNLAAAFLRPDGQMRAAVPREVLLRHLDHLIGRLGEDRVGLGSDFDGAVVPDWIRDVGGLPQLREAMAAHGYDDALMEKLMHGNWLRVLDKVWHR